MRMLFIYGPAAAGKLTIGQVLAQRTGYKLFHNHLIVDAVGAVFPFGTPRFAALREQFWLTTFQAAAEDGVSLIFTFQPEPSVAGDFPERVRALVHAEGGEVAFVRLTLSRAEQERRINAPSRADYGKLRSLDLLRELRASFEACEAQMPEPHVTIDTETTDPDEVARRVCVALGL